MEEKNLNTMTLCALFDSKKEELLSQLSNLVLPKDANVIEKVITNYFNGLFDSNSAFRQNLIQSEDYILQSAISLLNAQRVLVEDFASIVEKSTSQSVSVGPVESQQNSNLGSSVSRSIKDNPKSTIIGGAAIGGSTGALVFGSLGAIAGAIAGTALAVYNTSMSCEVTNAECDAIAKAYPIDANSIADIVRKICGSIDNLLETYRVQTRRITNAYEMKEKPSLLNDYALLIEQVANVCKTADNLSEPIPSKLKQVIECMAESLENYDLKYENGKIINA